MVRPGRTLWDMRRVVRRRHRTWMLSMGLATAGWAVIWISLVLNRWAPGWAPPASLSYGLAGSIALLGLLLAIFTVRAQLTWLLFCAAPVFANASLLALRPVVPWLLEPHEAASTELAPSEEPGPR